MTIPYSGGWAFAVLPALLLIVPAHSGITDLCHLIPVAHVAEVTAKTVAIERQSTGAGNCVYYVGEVRGDPPLPDSIVEVAHDDDSGALYAPMFFAGHEVAYIWAKWPMAPAIMPADDRAPVIPHHPASMLRIWPTEKVATIARYPVKPAPE